MPELPTSAQIPAGQTRPIRIPKGSMLSVEPATPGRVIGGKLNFYYGGSLNTPDYPLQGLNVNATYDFEYETGCFQNESTVLPPEAIIVSAYGYPGKPKKIIKSTAVNTPKK